MNEAGRPREFIESEIIMRGVDFFRANGYSRGSMQHLLEHLGISRQSLYNAFGNKRQFFLRCLQEYRNKSYETIFMPLLEKEASLNQLDATLNKLIAKLIKEPEKNCLIMKSTMELGTSDEDIGEQIEKHRKTIEKALRNVLTNEQKQGHLMGINIDVAIDAGVSMIYGIHVMARGGAKQSSLTNSKKAYFYYLGFQPPR